MATAADVCNFCLKNTVKYTCPRCNVQYCSVDCYKSEAHANCSEEFYKKCFMEGLAEMKTSSPEQQAEIMNILKRVHESNLESEENDDEEDEDLCERIKGINLDTEADKLWSALTETEKAEFEGMMQKKKLSHVVDLWAPWWRKGQKKVTEMNSQKTEKEVNVVPKIFSHIEDISKLLKAKSPARNIPFSIINVLCCYVHVCRMSNGDCEDMLLLNVQDLQQLCSGLKQEVYPSVSAAVYEYEHILTHCCHHLIVSPQYTTLVIFDVITILAGPSSGYNAYLYVLAALSHMRNLFSAARKELIRSDQKFNPRLSKPDTQTLFVCQKKLEFFLSYAKEYYLFLSSCIPELKSLHEHISKDRISYAFSEKLHESRKKAEGAVSEPKSDRKLIEEL